MPAEQNSGVRNDLGVVDVTLTAREALSRQARRSGPDVLVHVKDVVGIVAYVTAGILCLPPRWTGCDRVHVPGRSRAVRRFDRHTGQSPPAASRHRIHARRAASYSLSQEPEPAIHRLLERGPQLLTRDRISVSVPECSNGCRTTYQLFWMSCASWCVSIDLKPARVRYSRVSCSPHIAPRPAPPCASETVIQCMHETAYKRAPTTPGA